MKFVETPIFTKEVRALLSDEEYRNLQIALVLRPEQGRIVPGSGGLRKIRWKAKGRGKRGGVRLIYYWVTSASTIYMLMAYDKSALKDLTPEQARILKRLVQEELG